MEYTLENIIRFQAEEIKMAAQLRGPVLPIKKHLRREKALPVTDELKKFPTYSHMRRVRIDKRLCGLREKKAKESAEETGGKR